MAVALAATVDPARLDVRLEVTGIPAGADTYTISRRSPSGNEAAVRGAFNAAVSGTSAIARDWEAPFDVELVYTVTAYDGTTVLETATATVTVAYGQCAAWLVDLARPTNSLAVVIQDMHELQFDLANGVHRILNRRAPVMTMLPAWTPSAELAVLTDTLAQRDQVRALWGAGYPFLLRTTPDLGIGNMYLGLTGFVEERILADGRAPERRMRAAVIQVERPDPGLFVPTAPNTYQHVKDTWATYADMLAAVGTYDQLAYIFPGGDASPVIPWLPDDI